MSPTSTRPRLTMLESTGRRMKISAKRISDSCVRHGLRRRQQRSGLRPEDTPKQARHARPAEPQVPAAASGCKTGGVIKPHDTPPAAPAFAEREPVGPSIEARPGAGGYLSRWNERAPRVREVCG